MFKSNSVPKLSYISAETSISVNSDDPRTILDENSPRVKQSPKILIPLKEHQLATVYAVRQNEDDKHEDYITNISIVCDKVGAGKSYSILGIIADKPQLDLRTYTYDVNCYFSEKNKQIDSEKYIKTNIIIVPHTLIRQWSEYLNNTTLKYYVVKGDKDIILDTEINHKKIVGPEATTSINMSSMNIQDDDDKGSKKLTLLQLMSKDRNMFEFVGERFISHMSNYEVILVSNTKATLIDNMLYFKKKVVSRLIIDEYDVIKLSNVNYGSAVHTILVSATSERNDSYLNRSSELYTKINSAIINNIYLEKTKVFKHLLSRVVIKNTDDFINKSFVLPEIVYINYLYKFSQIASTFSGILPEDIAKNIMNGDITAVIEYLGIKCESLPNIVEAITDKLNKKLHNLGVEYNMRSSMLYETEAHKQSTLKNLDTQINILKENIAHITSKVKEPNCAICIDNINKKTVSLCCNTTFCFECICMWLKEHKTCPYCRANLNIKDIVVESQAEASSSQDEIKEIDENGVYINKFCAFKNAVQLIRSKDMRLIFTAENDCILERYTNYLSSIGIICKEIKGTGDHINHVIKMYKEGSVSALCVNANNYGSGLNLEMTTHIIITHNMLDINMKQIIGRAQRPGRTTPLTVIKITQQE